MASGLCFATRPQRIQGIFLSTKQPHFIMKNNPHPDLYLYHIYNIVYYMHNIFVCFFVNMFLNVFFLHQRRQRERLGLGNNPPTLLDSRHGHGHLEMTRNAELFRHSQKDVFFRADSRDASFLKHVVRSNGHPNSLRNSRLVSQTKTPSRHIETPRRLPRPWILTRQETHVFILFVSRVSLSGAPCARGRGA